MYFISWLKLLMVHSGEYLIDILHIWNINYWGIFLVASIYSYWAYCVNFYIWQNMGKISGLESSINDLIGHIFIA